MARFRMLSVVFCTSLFLGGCGVVPSAPDLWPFNNEYIVPGTPLGEASEN
ncbi:MAG: hypothetical protein AAGA73_17070 [Pseudomonadota bacterium]